MNDLISIIVPVYNVEKYLEECLDSILKQTYKNIEIIIINDGSRDNSGIICDRYAMKDKRIKVIHQDNRGLSVSRNNGLKASRGKYVSFVDSDDIIDPRMIELMYKEIINNKCQISICKFQLFKDNYLENEFNYQVQVMKQDEFFKRLMRDREISSHVCNKLFDRSLFEGIEFVVGRKYEDIGTTYKLGYKVNLVCYLNAELYGYRTRDDSIVNNLKKDILLDYIDMVNERYNDLIVKKEELKPYIDMNRINCITRYFLMIAYQDKKELFQEQDLKERLENELVIAKGLVNKDIRRINTWDEKLASGLLRVSPKLFYYVMREFNKFRNLFMFKK